jgi:hypothetical protein
VGKQSQQPSSDSQGLLKLEEDTLCEIEERSDQGRDQQEERNEIGY